MDRKSEIAVEKGAGGRKRYGFFSPLIFYLPSVSHPYKNRIGDIKTREEPIPIQMTRFLFFHKGSSG